MKIMDSKKRIIVLMTLVVVSIIISGFVSAGWLSDLLGFGEGGEDLEGELATEQAEAWVEILPSADPAVVVFVSEPTPYGSGGTSPGFVSLKQNDTEEFTFT